MADPTINIKVNLDGLTGQLQRSLQRAMNQVALGLQASNHLGGYDLELPSTSMRLALASTEAWDDTQRKAEFRRWILMNGFRDTAEAIGVLLEEAHHVIALWRLSLERVRDGKLSGAAWNEVFTYPARRFHRLGLSDKVKHLEQRYDFTLDSKKAAYALGINAARNCLTHRQGVVTERDANATDGLVVSWERLAVMVQDSDGLREIVPPAMVGAGGQISLEPREVRKRFALGGTIEFTVQEFSDICWSLYAFGVSTTQLLEKYGRAKGVSFRAPGSA